VECNRSLRHPKLFSVITAPLAPGEKQIILRDYYFPYRKAVESWIRAEILRSQQVLHLSIHTFTPSLDGKMRKADIGLLYDPTRVLERQFCVKMNKSLLEADPSIKIRKNYPYLGKSDGFTTHLRKRFPGNKYLGLELEVNQTLPLRQKKRWTNLQKNLAQVIFSLNNSLWIKQKNG
jgi:predicted N-formylglutamate amidohydrolase